MAFTYGFYNYNADDVEPKLYDAEQMSRIFDGIISDGVYAHVGSSFHVTAPTNNRGNTVIVGSGRAWFDHTWNFNDGDMVLSGAPDSPLNYKRIDAVVIDIDKREQNRCNKLTWVEGDVAPNPVRPTLAKDPDHTQYALAYVTRIPERNVIFDKDIKNVVGTTQTPFVAGIIDSLDASVLLSDLENDFWSMADGWSSEFTSIIGEFNTWFNNSQSSFNSLLSESSSSFSTFMSTSNASFTDFLTAKSGTFDRLLSSKSDAFDSWFGDVQNDYTELINNDTRRFNAWFDGVKDEVNAELVGDQSRFNTWFNSVQNDYTTLIADDTTRFNEFLGSLQTSFDRFVSSNQTTFNNLVSDCTATFNSYLSGLDIRFEAYTGGLDNDFRSFIESEDQDFDAFIETKSSEFDSFVTELREYCEEVINVYGRKSEGFAVGTQDGTNVDPDSPYYHNNSKYYCEQSETAATRAVEAKNDIYAALGIPDFSVDFDTGNLMYTNTSEFEFVINTSTGQLEYSKVS